MRSGPDSHPDLNTDAIKVVISKGTDPEREAYSGFDAPELLPILQRRNIRRLWVGGLATEYCVRATVLDGRKHGFAVFVIADAVRGIEANPGDCDTARRAMEAAGAVFVRSRDIFRYERHEEPGAAKPEPRPF